MAKNVELATVPATEAPVKKTREGQQASPVLVVYELSTNAKGEAVAVVHDITRDAFAVMQAILDNPGWKYATYQPTGLFRT